MESPPKITLDALRRDLRSVEPAALLVEPRILRRVIRLDQRLPGLGLAVPHRKCYTLERDRLLAFVDRAELELPPEADLPPGVILLSKPTDEETLDWDGAETALLRYWRLLFHSRVHRELDRRFADFSGAEIAADRRQRIGDIEFAEIRAVLMKDEFLFPTPTDLHVYIEFAAVYLELRYFAEPQLALYFPAIRDWAAIDAVVSQDLDHAQVFAQTRLPGAPPPKSYAPNDVGPQTFDWTPGPVEPPQVSPSKSWKLQARAKRAAALGNSVKAARLHMLAARIALMDEADEMVSAAHRELMVLCRRLQQVLDLSDRETDAWCAALEPLLAPAAQGYWSNEARLLYDLQKVCVEHERGVFKLDLIEWVRTLGRRPVRRSLPLLREVLITRHLRTADRRVPSARMNADDRQRLAALLAAAVDRIEHRSRDRIRPLISDIFDEVGLIPQNVPETVARRKLVEELLDHVVEHGYVSMGDLRDSLSKNDLKLPDVAGLKELVLGDRLLRADRKLDAALDGVYRRGAVYLRWPQTISSMAFGTGFGRFVTQYLAVPFGGAYLLLEFLRHMVAAFSGAHAADHGPTAASMALQVGPEPQWLFYGYVFLLGVWLALLIHRPTFRSWNVALFWQVWRISRKVLIDYPARLLRSELVQQILNSQVFGAIQAYLLRPALLTALFMLPFAVVGRPWSLRTALDVFLVATVFLNSPVGRYVTEVVNDFVVQAWHEVKIRIFAAVYQWIMDIFHGLMVALERVVYTVDEWLRFRAGDNRFSQAVKLVAGVVWFFVAYVVVFVFTLLVEPQINPIKHFPVVTVSHKVILPSGPVFVKQLTPYIGAARANTLVWTTIWLVPGVFGFLVWELKENWRLYDANRSLTLRPAPIGHHGETMLRLLRPGFHSGTLPKAFAALRRAARKAERTGDWKPVNHRRVSLRRVEESVRRFVERELIELLEEVGFHSGESLNIGEVAAATNRIEVELRCDAPQRESALLTWHDHGGRLTASIVRMGWLSNLTTHDRKTFQDAWAGLCRRAGVDSAAGFVSLDARAPITWEEWVTYWSRFSALTTIKSEGRKAPRTGSPDAAGYSADINPTAH